MAVLDDLLQDLDAESDVLDALVAPLDAVQFRVTCALPALAVGLVGAAGTASCGVAETSADLPLSPLLLTAVTW